MPDNTTSPLPDDRASGPPPRPALSDVFALVLVWSDKQPWRVGEVALLRGEGPWTIGRGRDPISRVRETASESSKPSRKTIRSA